MVGVGSRGTRVTLGVVPDYGTDESTKGVRISGTTAGSPAERDLCAQIAGILPTPYALDLAVRMTDPFLAEVSAAIDPRSAGEVVRRMPQDRLVSVAQILLSRGEYVTAARFVDYLEPDGPE